MDIALKDWTDDKLPQMAINVGWQTLFKQLETIMTTKKADREIGDLFQPLKANILETVKAQHAWQSTALKRLVRKFNLANRKKSHLNLSTYHWLVCNVSGSFSKTLERETCNN